LRRFENGEHLPGCAGNRRRFKTAGGRSAFLITQGTITRRGIALFAALVVYSAYSIWLAKKEVSAEIEEQFREGVPSQSKSLYIDLIFIGGGLLLLVAGSRLLVISATVWVLWPSS
jgi:Ca2+/Na+ antiporter